MHTPITLRSKRFSAGVAPTLGGSLAWFGLADDPSIDFVRPTSARTLGDGNARMASSYPLVPYSNRIGDGRFRFDGRDIALQRNTEISEHPIHGVGFLGAWSVVSTSDGEATIALEHDGQGGRDADWPWSFSAVQAFTLDDNGLRVRIAMRNRDSRDMPAGIGLHPFFPKPPSTRLRFAADAVWINDARMLPVARNAVPEAFDFRAMRPVASLAVDNCFAGWNGMAELEWPERGWGLRIGATTTLGHLIVFTSPVRDAIAIEPVSHANNAVNLAASRDDTGLVSLAPGATLEGTMSLVPFALGDLEAG